MGGMKGVREGQERGNMSKINLSLHALVNSFVGCSVCQ